MPTTTGLLGFCKLLPSVLSLHIRYILLTFHGYILILGIDIGREQMREESSWEAGILVCVQWPSQGGVSSHV